MVARLSGDEFGLIIDGKQPAAGIALAEQAAEALGQDFAIDGKSVRTGLTTGIAVFPHNGSDAASLLANSGAALFRAKAKSRGTISHVRARDGPADPRSPRAAPGALGGDQERRIVALLPAAGRRGDDASPPARSSASRRWRAGTIRCAASCRPATSFRWRKKAA